MDKKPVIGIIGKVQPKSKKDLWNQIAEADEFRYLVVKHGGMAIVLLPTQESLKFNDNDIKDETVLSERELKDLFRQLDFCDGFILQGGLYSCNYEIEMAKEILKRDKPLIGICAGFNNILRALGTDVVVDETENHNHYQKKYRHKITIEPDTVIGKIIGESEYDVNSIHTMIEPKEMAEGFVKIAAYSEDGLVEAFEVPGKKFAIGIKWHPELMLDEEYVDRLFKRFIDEASGLVSGADTKKKDKKNKKGKDAKNKKEDTEKEKKNKEAKEEKIKEKKEKEEREDKVKEKTAKKEKNEKTKGKKAKAEKVKEKAEKIKNERTEKSKKKGEETIKRMCKAKAEEKYDKEKEIKRLVKEYKKKNSKKIETQARYYFALHNQKEMDKLLSSK